MDRSRGKGVVGGLMFVVLGVATVIGAQDYPFGTPGNMGPGFFPVILGSLLGLLGLANAGVAWRGTAVSETGHAKVVRSLMLPLGVLVFGMLVDRAGVVIATLGLVGCVCMAGMGLRYWEVAIVAAVLVAVACLLFVYGLQLPISYLLPS